MNKVIFIGAGPGDPELITVKAKKILESQKLYYIQALLCLKKLLDWAPDDCIIESSETMDYEEIFTFFEKHIKTLTLLRVHTGDPSIYSTIAKQIKFLNSKALI